MRIISGEFRRRVLNSPEGLTTRPMPDRVKESIFSMLGGVVEGAHVVDLFAGSGSVGLEAISRGAASCVFVEMDRVSAGVLESNVALLGVQERCRVIRGDALGLSIVARCPRPSTLIFMDPPYPLVRTSIGWERVRGQASQLVKLLSEDGFLLLRTPRPHEVEVPAVGGVEGVVVGKRGKGHKRPRVGNWRDVNVGGGAGGGAGRGDERGVVGKKKGDGGRWFAPADFDKLEVDDEEGAAGGVGDAPVVVPEVRPASYEIVGARGPEVHVYGSMAMNLYMRDGGGK